jgi:predicted DsbA family dithiol-disulfide isomerase
LLRFAEEVGLPMDPPQRNYNSRFALETAELIRDKNGDEQAGAFHHDALRAFFVDGADISKPYVVIPMAERQGVSAADVEHAWHERRYSLNVDELIQSAFRAGVTGVPAMAWPDGPAVVGMRRPDDLVAALSER